MSQQLIFITIFLGLISGPRQVDLQVGQAIRLVRLQLDGQQVAELHEAPWSATVDFGAEIAPGELVATGYDQHGQEVARVSQQVNLPRPTAEFVIVFEHNAKGIPTAVQLRWKHLLGKEPEKSSLTVDGKDVSLDAAMRAALPRLDMDQPHVLAATISFPDGVVARREIVVGGTNGDLAVTQLTPIAVRTSTNTLSPADADCFTNAGTPVRMSAIETSPGLVIFVIDPDHGPTLKALDPAQDLQNGAVNALVKMVPLDRGTWMHVQWPIAEQYRTTNNSTSTLFPITHDVEASDTGLVWLLTRSVAEHAEDDKPRQTADAVLVAGLNAMKGAHRRAVVLLLSRHKDASTFGSAASRKYLSTIGVPLFVWSVDGPPPDLKEEWGDIEDVSSLPALRVAADHLRAELASQRVAWVAADPLTALRVQPTGRCGITPLAH